MAIRVTVEGTDYMVHQREGFVMVYRRAQRGPYFRDSLFWDSRKTVPKIGSVAAQVLVKASKFRPLDLSGPVAGQKPGGKKGDGRG